MNYSENLNKQKEKALSEYKKARADYMANTSAENWKLFCDAKRCCRLLGCII